MQKSLCVLFLDPSYPRNYPMIGNVTAEWSSSLNYLDVQFMSGKHIKTDVGVVNFTRLATAS